MPVIDGTPACLILHGLGGSRSELAPLIDRLILEGCTVAAPVLPGHDFEALGPVMPGSTWPEWIATAEASFEELARSGRPVVVIGFSTGGTLGLLLADRRPVARLVLLAPFLTIKFAGLIPLDPSTAVRVLAHFKPDLPRRSAPIRDPEARRRFDELARFRTFSLHATLSALELIERVKPLVPTIRTPTLILQGRLDSVVDPGGAAWLADHLGSDSRRLVSFDRSDHLLALDFERDQVVAEATSFALGIGD
jgi:carboxylesterase